MGNTMKKTTSDKIFLIAGLIGSDRCAVIDLARQVHKAIIDKEIESLISIALCVEAFHIKEMIFLDIMAATYNACDNDTKKMLHKVATDKPHSIAARLLRRVNSESERMQ